MSVILIVHNVRSCYNVGSLLRTSDGLGVGKVYLTGYTPYPVAQGDSRLPHLAAKADRQIHKTALGAEHAISWEHRMDLSQLITELKHASFTITAFEQNAASVPLPAYRSPANVALIVGREVEGIEPEILTLADNIVEIPMRGQKESFNVAAAAAMALYRLTYP